MSALNSPENFAGRVAYAAATISAGNRSTRSFDNCFENYDGDEVAVAVYRRALKNPKLMANFSRYLSLNTVLPCVEKLKDVATRDLPAVAAETRARRRRERDETFARWDAEKAETGATV